MVNLELELPAFEDDIKTPHRHRQGNRIGYSQRRASLGVLACYNSADDRDKIKDWKKRGGDEPTAAIFAETIASLIRQWSPVLPVASFVTTPPQGASSPGQYCAEMIAREVSRQIGRPYKHTLYRLEPKISHHPQQSVQQNRFYAEVDRYGFAIVVDDMITSGTTMKLSLEAIRSAGCPAFGFSYVGT